MGERGGEGGRRGREEKGDWRARGPSGGRGAQSCAEDRDRCAEMAAAAPDVTSSTLRCTLSPTLLTVPNITAATNTEV